MHNAAQSTKAERNTASIRCSPEGVKNEHRLKNGVSAANDSAPETEAPAEDAAATTGANAELLMKLLANPEMAALLKTLAQTLK